MPEWLRRRAEDMPDRPALIVGDRAWTYAQLDAAVTRLALRLATHGIGADDPVGVLLRNGPHFACAVHALIRLGAILVPLNTRLRAPELAWQARHARIRLLTHDHQTAGMASGVAGQLSDTLPMLALTDTAPYEEASTSAEGAPYTSATVATDAARDGDEARQRLREHIDLSATQCIMYTSGTTGHPKGVLLTYGNHWWGAISSALNLGLHAGDRWLACLPLFHVGGLSILLRGAIYGIPVVFPDPPGAPFDPVSVTRALTKHRATIISVVSAQLQRLLDAGLQGAGRSGSQESALRCVLLGGGPAPRPLLEECARRGIPVAQTYGLTETCSQVATLAPDDALRKLGSAGRPLLATELRIEAMGAESSGAERPAEGEAPAQGAPAETMPRRDGPRTTAERMGGQVGAGGARRDDTGAVEYVVGEILVRGPTVTPGYLAPDEEGSIRRATDGEGWLHTGDVGYLDADGYLSVLDRRTDLIISGGENVYPAEVEAVLLAHPAIAEAGVFGVPDPVWGQRVAAAVVARPESTIDEAELIAFCRERVAAYKVPARVEQCEALPRNAAGKLLRRELARGT